MHYNKLSNGKLKQDTIQTIAERDLARGNQFLFRQASTGSTAGTILKDMAEVADNLTKSEKSRREYNANLHKLDPEYLALTPRHDWMIIRHFLRAEEIRTKGGVLALNKNQVLEKKPSGIDGDAIDDPFNFHRLAIVVAVPDYMKADMPAGTLILVNPPKLGVQKDKVLGYEGEFMHPRNQSSQVPTNPEDADFGYRMISERYAPIIIERSETLLESLSETAD